MRRYSFGILLCTGLLCALAAVASALPAPAFTATYWWKADGSTQINGERPRDAIVSVDQVDFYLEGNGPAVYGVAAPGDVTLFIYRVTNLGYMPTEGMNGLSGFELLDIGPFHYNYVGELPVDPVTGNPWLAISGPANEFAPEWEATWGLEPFTPNTYGLYPELPTTTVGNGVAPLSTAFFAYTVDGFVGIGERMADVHSWGIDPDLEIGVPVAFHYGLVSAPVIPEPRTLLLMGVGIAGLVMLRRRA
ncbi:MAG: PEP-CTERM sorting domain-containing protein [Candidatus Eisenbacteria bacterium]|nr:PEP-CTERM sorting domain-containing protein [Candidatus Eisenbacteria bacterium]